MIGKQILQRVASFNTNSHNISNKNSKSTYVHEKQLCPSSKGGMSLNKSTDRLNRSKQLISDEQRNTYSYRFQSKQKQKQVDDNVCSQKKCNQDEVRNQKCQPQYNNYSQLKIREKKFPQQKIITEPYSLTANNSTYKYNNNNNNLSTDRIQKDNSQNNTLSQITSKGIIEPNIPEINNLEQIKQDQNILNEQSKLKSYSSSSTQSFKPNQNQLEQQLIYCKTLYKNDESFPSDDQISKKIAQLVMEKIFKRKSNNYINSSNNQNKKNKINMNIDQINLNTQQNQNEQQQQNKNEQQQQQQNKNQNQNSKTTKEDKQMKKSLISQRLSDPTTPITSIQQFHIITESNHSTNINFSPQYKTQINHDNIDNFKLNSNIIQHQTSLSNQNNQNKLSQNNNQKKNYSSDQQVKITTSSYTNEKIQKDQQLKNNGDICKPKSESYCNKINSSVKERNNSNGSRGSPRFNQLRTQQKKMKTSRDVNIKYSNIDESTIFRDQIKQIELLQDIIDTPTRQNKINDRNNEFIINYDCIDEIAPSSKSIHLENNIQFGQVNSYLFKTPSNKSDKSSFLQTYQKSNKDVKEQKTCEKQMENIKQIQQQYYEDSKKQQQQSQISDRIKTETVKSNSQKNVLKQNFMSPSSKNTNSDKQINTLFNNTSRDNNNIINKTKNDNLNYDDDNLALYFQKSNKTQQIVRKQQSLQSQMTLQSGGDKQIQKKQNHYKINQQHQAEEYIDKKNISSNYDTKISSSQQQKQQQQQQRQQQQCKNSDGSNIINQYQNNIKNKQYLDHKLSFTFQSNQKQFLSKESSKINTIHKNKSITYFTSELAK